jgi:hypothetical protein
VLLSIAGREIASHRWCPVSFVFGELPNGADVPMDPEPVRLAKRTFDPAPAQFHRCEPLLVTPESTRSRLRWAEYRGMIAVAPKTPPSSQAGPPPM